MNVSITKFLSIWASYLEQIFERGPEACMGWRIRFDLEKDVDFLSRNFTMDETCVGTFIRPGKK